jgi:hypothetical protein
VPCLVEEPPSGGHAGACGWYVETIRPIGVATSCRDDSNDRPLSHLCSPFPSGINSSALFQPVQSSAGEPRGKKECIRPVNPS